MALVDSPATPPPPTPVTASTNVSNTTTNSTPTPLLTAASTEIEHLRHHNSTSLFPPACLALVQRLPGNHRCMDCGDHNPQWAAVRYGALVCLHCSGHHRSLGVQISTVRSLRMDEWSPAALVTLLEGGNAQLANFFARHQLTVRTATRWTPATVPRLRYKTKAAVFYRQQMELHVQRLLDAGPYRGRERPGRGEKECEAAATAQGDEDPVE